MKPNLAHADPLQNASGPNKTRLEPASARSERDLLLFAASCFRGDDPRARPGRFADAEYWPQVVDFANRELLAPALWSALLQQRRASSVPAAQADRLRHAHAINGIRNERIRAELESILRALNAACIVPVLLKGAVDLYISRYADPAARVMRDLDLFVLESDHPRAIAALAQVGYRVKERGSGWLTSATDLVRKGALMPVDLQWLISGQRDVLSPEEGWAGSTVHRVGDIEFRTLSPEHQVVHNLLHSELQDRGSDIGFVWLRQLVDFDALCRLHLGTIGWREVRQRFARRGVAHVPVARLYMANRLLGLPMPPDMAPTLRARLHYARCLTLLRSRWVLALAGLIATVRSTLDKRLLQTIYADAGGRRSIAWLRLRHTLRLLRHYGGNLSQVWRDRTRKFNWKQTLS